MTLIKRFAIILFVVVILLTLSLPILAIGSNTPYDIYGVTLEEIQTIVEKHLAKYQPDIEIGTHDFYDYVVAQLFDETDDVLCSLENYNIIHSYLVEYKLAYDDYLICCRLKNDGNVALAENIASKSACITYNKDCAEISFVLSDAFLEQTLGEIRDKNIAKSNAAISARKTDTFSSRAYSSYAAVAYARQYAMSRNYNYPDYTDAGGDCTNFVSQCLHAGGISMNGSSSGSGTIDTVYSWYCINNGNGILNMFAVTTSWMRAADFYTYMQEVGARYWILATSITQLHSNCAVGDIVQLSDSISRSPYHSVIITKKDSQTSYYCGHSSNRYDEPITSMPSNNCFTIFKYS